MSSCAMIGVRPWPPPTKTSKPTSPASSLHDADADVVDRDRGAIVLRAGDGDLELARQERELGVERRPLAQDLAVRARVDDLVARDAGEGIGGDVADAVAARLDGVHLDLGQLVEDRPARPRARPVELHVLPRREVAVALVVGPRDVGQLAQLAPRQEPVGIGDAQHVGVQLDVEAVHGGAAAGT
jgi:hypothetical protein